MFCSALTSRQELTVSAVKSHSSGPSPLWQCQGSCLLLEQVLQVSWWDSCHICLDRTRMSRVMNVPRYWVFVTGHEHGDPGEGQRLSCVLVWPSHLFLFCCLLFMAHLMGCGTGACRTSHVNTKLFLQWPFRADVSMCLVFLPSTCNFFTSTNSKLLCSRSCLDTYMIPMLLMLLFPIFASGLQKHLLPFCIFPLWGNCGSLENVRKAKGKDNLVSTDAFSNVRGW